MRARSRPECTSFIYTVTPPAPHSPRPSPLATPPAVALPARTPRSGFTRGLFSPHTLVFIRNFQLEIIALIPPTSFCDYVRPVRASACLSGRL